MAPLPPPMAVAMAETPLWTHPRRSRVLLSGADAIADHLDRIHGATLRFATSPRASPTTPKLTHSWVDIGPVVLDDIATHSVVTVSRGPLNKVVVVWVQRGAMRLRCGDHPLSPTRRTSSSRDSPTFRTSRGCTIRTPSRSCLTRRWWPALSPSRRNDRPLDNAPIQQPSGRQPDGGAAVQIHGAVHSRHRPSR